MRAEVTFDIIKQNLTQRGIPFEEITFTDIAVSARTRDTSIDNNYDPHTAIKTLVISTKDGFKAVILKGDDRIDQSKLKQIVGKWSVVDKQTLENKFGYHPGGINPLVLDLPILIDKDAFALETWSMGAGDQTKGVNIKNQIVLKHLTQYQTVSVRANTQT